MNNTTNNMNINFSQEELCMIVAFLEEGHEGAKAVGKKVEALWIAMETEQRELRKRGVKDAVVSINTVPMLGAV